MRKSGSTLIIRAVKIRQTVPQNKYLHHSSLRNILLDLQSNAQTLLSVTKVQKGKRGERRGRYFYRRGKHRIFRTKKANTAYDL